MYAYATGGPFGLERHGHHQRAGAHAALSLDPSFFLVHPRFARGRGTHHGDSRRGGFYRWVRAGFGDFWGFLAGWWNWSASVLRRRVRRVIHGLLTNYLSFYFTIPGWMHYAIAIAVIAVIGYINVRGIQMVGTVASILEISILAPIVVLCAIAPRSGSTIRLHR